MTRRVALALGVALLTAAACAQEAQDVLYLQDGRERVGELVRITPEAVVFRVAGAAEPTEFPKDQVQRLDLSRQRAGDAAQTVAALGDPLLERLLANAPVKFAFPDSGHVVMYELYDCAVDPDGGYTVRERRVEKIFLERGKDRANVARSFKQGEETLEIDFARTINPDGTITPISDAGVDVTNVHADKPEYDKLRQTKFAMKQIMVDSVIDYQVTLRRPATDLLNPLFVANYFRTDEPILESELRIAVPPGVELNYRDDRLGPNVEFTRLEQGDRVVYRWYARNCPRVVPEPMMPPAGDLYPRVTAAVATTWAQIGDAYAAALRESNVPSDEIRDYVAARVADAGDRPARARAIYHDFIKTFHQQWVSPRQYSYAPRPVADVFAKRAGNTIDKALLLTVMLEEAGLPAAVVLACPQSQGQLVADVPCLKQFTDALVAVMLPGGRQFLSLTSETVRFGQLPARYQGTTGLLVTATGSELVEIPLNPPAAEGVATTYRMELREDGDLVVHKTETYAGNSEIEAREAWKDLKDEELRRQLEVALTAMHPKARLETYAFENLHDVTQPLRFTQTCTLEDYAMRASDELLVFQLPEVDYSAGAVGKPEREFPMRWYLRQRNTKDMAIAVPAGWNVYYAGKDYEATCDPLTFLATFRHDESTVHYHDESVQRALAAPASAYDEYKAAIETRARVPKEWIVLERTAS